MASEWKLRRGADEYPVGTVATLNDWTNAGRIAPTDYIFNPVLERWMYAIEVAEIASYFAVQKSRASNENLNRMSWGLGLLGLLLLILFWPAGVVVLIIAVVMSALYQVNRSSSR